MINLFVSSVFVQALLLYSANAHYAVPAASSCVSPNNWSGVCVGIRQCPVLLHILQMKPLPPGGLEFLRQSQCGFEGRDPRVCCPIRRSSVTAPPQTDQDQSYNAGTDLWSRPGPVVDPNASYDIFDHPLLPTECGRDVSHRIFGGERTDIDEFPWMALLEYEKPYGRSTACGGVLISKRYVLTAAHCVKGTTLPKSWRLTNVRLGEYDTVTNLDCVHDGNVKLVCADASITVDVEEQIVHENYQPDARVSKHDIALLRLTRDVSFTNYVKPICLPSNGSIPPKLYAAGWGITENRTASNVKLKVSLPYVDKDRCQATYSTYRYEKITLGAGQICAGGQWGKDTCTGDSGGPLMAFDTTWEGTGKWSAIGVVSFGMSPCGMSGWPGVYTKVNDFVPWILSKMRP